MPELPEVETIVRGLKKHVVGREIADVIINVPKLFRGDLKLLEKSKIIDVERRGKVILIRLDNTLTLGIHLKMTGQLIFLNQESKGIVGGHPDRAYGQPLPHKHTHILMKFKDGSVLYYNDIRKFGWWELFSHEKNNLSLLKKLGPDPLIKVDEKYLAEVFKKRTRITIKSALLDQTILAGIGNIYADETLFLAGVLPTRLAGSLKLGEINKIATAIPEVLNKSLKAGGTSRSDYVQIDGSKGGYLKLALVYGREGLGCRKCQNKIIRIKVGQRSSHFCDKCQK